MSSYDFNRKRLSVLCPKEITRLMVTKGPLTNIMAVCSSAKTPEGIHRGYLPGVREHIERQFETLSR